MIRALLLIAILAGPAAAVDTIELKDIKLTTADGKESELLGHNEGDSKLFFFTNGIATATYTAKENGTFKLTLDLSCDEAKKEMAKIKISVGDTVVEKSFELKQADVKSYEFKVDLKKGENKIKIEFLNDEYKENEFDRNLYLHSMKVDK